jgi:NADP-dependent 3-hydroxy acid dehydrogenase YdfG
MTEGHGQPARTALVTGAGSGIGRATSVALAREGYAVVLAGRHEDTLRQVAAEAAEAGGSTDVVPTDITSPAAVASLFGHIEQQWGRLDLLFNNAGRAAPEVALEEVSYEDWTSVVQTNLTGSFLCTQHAFRIMKRQVPRGGRIINNGSLAAHVPRPRSSPYAATKHAVTGLTRASALDGRQWDIACGQIDIGNAKTDMSAAFSHTAQADGTFAAEPTIDVDDVARAVVYMASLPLEANVQFMTIMATKMPFIGRG